MTKWSTLSTNNSSALLHLICVNATFLLKAVFRTHLLGNNEM